MALDFPKTYVFGGNTLDEYDDESWKDIQADPRGLLLLWEPPISKARYVLGMDPTEGITGWTRGSRVRGDEKMDNGVIEIFRINGKKKPVYQEIDGRKVQKLGEDGEPLFIYQDVQVGEYAAPCDAVELARVAAFLGRMFHGKDEEQCELIWEAYPGPGILSTQELLRLGYQNLWIWEFIGQGVAEESGQFGWRSHKESQKILWYRARRHLLQRKALLRSQFLLSEYANAVIDTTKMRAKASYGNHDDRLQAANMCFWAGHKWTYDVEAANEKQKRPKVVDFQNIAPGFEDRMSYADWRANAIDSMLDDDDE